MLRILLFRRYRFTFDTHTHTAVYVYSRVDTAVNRNLCSFFPRYLKNGGAKVLDWEKNTGLIELLTPVTLPRVSFIDVPIAGTDFKARVRLILPPSVDENANVKYPMLVNTWVCFLVDPVYIKYCELNNNLFALF